MKYTLKKQMLCAVVALTLTACGSSGSSSEPQQNAFDSAQNGITNSSELNTSSTKITQVSDVNTSSALSDEQKYALAYMWHEEKLAYDIYLALNELHPAKQFTNIANKSEVQHIAAVETLVEAYDINITNLQDYTLNYSEEELRAMGSGEFALPKVQELYDALYAKGIKTEQDALEVGCTVEVTDVNDLSEFISLFDSNSDVVTQFTLLRQDSYNHYWAFNNALEALGVYKGCCSLGEEYCKSVEEYPASKH